MSIYEFVVWLVQADIMHNSFPGELSYLS